MVTVTGKLFFNFFGQELGAPALGGLLDFAHPTMAAARILVRRGFEN